MTNLGQNTSIASHIPKSAWTLRRPSEQLEKGLNMSAIVDHMTLGVSDFENARRCYDRVMPALGFQSIWEKTTMVAYGVGRVDDFG